MDFVFAKLIFTLRLKKDIPDPYALFSVRNGFSDAFREVACRTGTCTADCADRGNCPFHMTFSQVISEDLTALRRHQKPSLPFMFDIPVLPATPNNGEEIELGLVIAGTAMNFIGYYINAVRRLFGSSPFGANFPAEMVRVESVTGTGYRNTVMKRGAIAALDEVTTISARDLMAMRTIDPNRIRLTIAAPMRLLRDGKPVRDFTFSALIRPLLRRISSLAYYYCGCRPEPDYRWLSEASASIGVSDSTFRWSRWGGERHGDRLSGIVGSGICEGILSDYHPFLLLGEFVHVGKGAPYGLGRYRID